MTDTTLYANSNVESKAEKRSRQRKQKRYVLYNLPDNHPRKISFFQAKQQKLVRKYIRQQQLAADYRIESTEEKNKHLAALTTEVAKGQQKRADLTKQNIDKIYYYLKQNPLNQESKPKVQP